MSNFEKVIEFNKSFGVPVFDTPQKTITEDDPKLTKLRLDLILEERKMKWVFKHAERSKAKTLVMITPNEWEQGKVRIKNLENKTEIDVNLEEI